MTTRSRLPAGISPNDILTRDPRDLMGSLGHCETEIFGEIAAFDARFAALHPGGRWPICVPLPRTMARRRRPEHSFPASCGDLS